MTLGVDVPLASGGARPSEAAAQISFSLKNAGESFPAFFNDRR
jgi:hypothetical protein